jgi:hypothetical protein
MVRFEGPDDDGYRKVKGQLAAWLFPKENREVKSKIFEAKKKQRDTVTITQYGATFGGNVSYGTLDVSQHAAGRNLYYHSSGGQMTDKESSQSSVDSESTY